jgi:putative ABC transport system permease protein
MLTNYFRIAQAISIPATCYLMSLWLHDFACHVGMGAGVFTLAVLLALLIAFITVSFRSVRAALANPVELLRNE